MFTGQLPFKGMHEAAVSYEIVNVDSPPMSSVKPGIPPELDAIVLECLAKDPDERFQSAKEIVKELRRFKRESSRERVSRVSQVRPAQDESSDASRQRKRLPISWIVATLLCAAAALALALLHFSEREQPRQVLRYSIFAPDIADFESTYTHNFSISPDGKILVTEIRDSLGKSMLWIRRLDAFTFQPLRGTDGASLPFWSPDSRFIGFFADGAMKKIEPGGGPAITICTASMAAGTWNTDGVIVFSQGESSPLYRVAAGGGIPTVITRLDSTRHETSHRFPQFLPDGKHFLFYSMIGSDEDAIKVGSLDGTAPQRLMSGSSFATYASGSLVYLREHTLMAQPFDAGSLIFTGDPTPIAENVNSSLYITGSAQFSPSANGVLLFQAGADRQIIQLNWYDRAGRKVGSVGEAAGYRSARIAPDGQRIAVSINDAKSRNEDIWLIDLHRGIRTRFTTDPSRDWLPVWSPDGRSIAFVTDRNKGTDIYMKESDGITAEHALLQTPADERPTDWSRDGKYILYQSIGNPGTGTDMWILPLGGDKKPYPFLKTEFSEGGGRFSPNVRWIAYSSNESGKSEVYVMPFPGSGPRISISNSGGNNPRWRGDGKEIFYLDPAKNVMAVQVRENGKTLEVLGAQILFQARPGTTTEGLFDVTSDGQRFLVITLPSARAASPLSVVVNWNEGLKAK
jgi:eukaryotic-like serine/threonine-protein kinase